MTMIDQMISAAEAIYDHDTLNLQQFKVIKETRHKIVTIVKYVHKHELFSKSQPAIDWDYVTNLMNKGFDLNDIYDKLLKMDLFWTGAKKTRKNWRRVLTDQLIRLEQYRNYRDRSKEQPKRRVTTPMPYSEPMACKCCGEPKEASELMIGGICVTCYQIKR